MFLIDSPIYEENFHRIIDFMELEPTQTVIDFGCGKGTLLKSLSEKYGITGIGIDKSKRNIDIAKQQIGDNPRIELITADINEFRTDQKYDLVSCFGIWYGFPGLKFLLRFLKPDGIILYGLNFWRKEPGPEYMEQLGIDETEKDFRTLDKMIDYFYQNGFTILYQYTNTKEECDHYQSKIWKGKKYSDMKSDHERKKYYIKWIREYHGWSAWLLRKDAR